MGRTAGRPVEKRKGRAAGPDPQGRRAPKGQAAGVQPGHPKAGEALAAPPRRQRQGSAGVELWAAREASQLLSASIDSLRRR